jgi:hypothetical protein
MPLTCQDNGVSMGGSLKEVSILKNCYISADPKGRLNSCPISCRGPLDHSGSGSGHATTRAQATLLLGIYELQYVLRMFINKLFGNNQLILVFFFLFSVALAQSTTGVTTATTMAATGGHGPLAPHMRPCAPR